MPLTDRCKPSGAKILKILPAGAGAYAFFSALSKTSATVRSALIRA